MNLRAGVQEDGQRRSSKHTSEAPAEEKQTIKRLILKTHIQ